MAFAGGFPWPCPVVVFVVFGVVGPAGGFEDVAPGGALPVVV